ncbi:hypothetical protein GUJ93_ZPchr0001g31627 [Zizania palustris]|uniref:Uncharacterized protein n=1 Tax=Zizania palustris TaxID=103762 RepID=A0A8J5V2V4_ZIZPA|nr:hypothetical protein GUJ93_ZPchr0001g31627 [Zizania palustris]
MAGANKSTRIVLSFVFLLVPLAAAASSLPLLNASLPDPATVVADFHRTDWRQDRQRLADCGISFGRNAMGGKGGPMYMVTDSSRPRPGEPCAGHAPRSADPSIKADGA